VKFVHLLSKDARRRIVEVMLNGRSLRELSELLGVTPAAISKYRSGATHPSDDVLVRILERAGEAELMEIARIAFNDLYSGFESLVEWMSARGLPDSFVVDRLKKLASRLEDSLKVRRAKIIIK